MCSVFPCTPLGGYPYRCCKTMVQYSGDEINGGPEIPRVKLASRICHRPCSNLPPVVSANGETSNPLIPLMTSNGFQDLSTAYQQMCINPNTPLYDHDMDRCVSHVCPIGVPNRPPAHLWTGRPARSDRAPVPSRRLQRFTRQLLRSGLRLGRR